MTSDVIVAYRCITHGVVEDTHFSEGEDVHYCPIGVGCDETCGLMLDGPVYLREVPDDEALGKTFYDDPDQGGPVGLTTEQIARVCHEANRGWQAASPLPGIPVAPAWDEFPPDQQAGVIAGVEKALQGYTPEQMHESWVADKLAQGWTYGPTKDAEAKTHPSLRAYDDLSDDDRAKDALFLGIVNALRPLYGEDPTRLPDQPGPHS
jgi:hypothetical protein